jgi:NADH:ubiquinone oxidoreductase subunit
VWRNPSPCDVFASPQSEASLAPALDIVPARCDDARNEFPAALLPWWNGWTIGTQVWTSLYGEFVGEDEFGNRYFRTRGGKIDPNLGFERRWVIYNGVAEASTVPPSWHGWLHHAWMFRRPWRRWFAPLVEAASAQYDRHARRASAHRLDIGAGGGRGDRRLQGLDAGAISL